MHQHASIDEWDSYIAAFDRATTFDEVFGLLTERMNYRGFDRCAYWLRWPHLPEKPHIILSTYPQNFLDRYREKDYGAFDMVGRFATNSNRPFAWKEIGRRYDLSPQQKIIFHDSSSVGLADGASVPIHGPGLTKATFSVAANLPLKQFEELFLFHRHEIHILSTAAHEKLMQLGLGETKANLQKLTFRENEILLWLSRGYKYWEISEKLNIQHDTVKKHTQNINRKLGASNTVHASSIAIVNGIIVP